MSQTARPLFDGIHHLKMPVTDLIRSRAWYERVLGLVVEVEFADDDGVVRGVAGTAPGLAGTSVALRENAVAAAGFAGFDPIAFAVSGRVALDAWIGHLDAERVEHSPVMRATKGWLVSFHDPDGIELRLYSRSFGP